MKGSYSRDNLNKEELELTWHSRLLQDYPEQNSEKRQSIIRWLVGRDLEQFDQLTSRQLAIATKVMEYRYRILHQRYLGVESDRAYGNLINRLGALMMLRRQIRVWATLSQERKKALANFIQAAIEEMLRGDRSLQQQIAWIAQGTPDRFLRNALLLSSIEEYCLRPIRNQPLLVDKLIGVLQSRYLKTFQSVVGHNGR